MRRFSATPIPEASLPKKMRISLAKVNFSDFIIGLA
jgi:hypothetical protein